jgi:hypothetical protein
LLILQVDDLESDSVVKMHPQTMVKMGFDIEQPRILIKLRGNKKRNIFRVAIADENCERGFVRMTEATRRYLKIYSLSTTTTVKQITHVEARKMEMPRALRNQLLDELGISRK